MFDHNRMRVCIMMLCDATLLLVVFLLGQFLFRNKEVRFCYNQPQCSAVQTIILRVGEYIGINKGEEEETLNEIENDTFTACKINKQINKNKS